MVKLFGVLFLAILGLTMISARMALRATEQVSSPREPRSEWSLLLGGDVMLGRSVTTNSLDTVKDPNYPFFEIGSLLRSADLTFVNLENPITDQCPRRNVGMVFCAPPEMLSGLLYAGVDVVNLSNNHTLNYGKAGYESTKKALSEVSLSYADHSTLATRTVKGVTVGFIGFDKSQQSKPTLTSAEEAFILESRKKVDVLITAMHWGVEYNAHPTDGQRTLAQRLVELGSTVVVGHHPHWVQDTTTINETPIYYSLGNLVFDQMWSEETKKGLIVKVTFDGSTVTKEEFIRTYMKKVAQPIIMPSPKE